MPDFWMQTRQNTALTVRPQKRNKNLMRKLLILAILAAAVVAVVIMTTMRPQPPRKERVELDPLVEIMVLEAMTEHFEVRSQGTVAPRTETVLSAEVTGTVTWISPKFVAGGVFEKGEVLLRIDPTNYDVALKQAEALVKQRQIEFDGASKLLSQGYRAEAEYASSAAALASAEAELVRAQRNLERTRIRLPYEGIVRSKETDLGQFVSPGTRLGVTFATDFAEVRLPLTDTDLAFIDLPEAGIMRTTADADGPAVTLSAIQKGRAAEWEATIVRTEGVVDEKSRVTYAVARIEDPYGLHHDSEQLPVGTFVSATIVGTVAEDIIRIPRAVVRGSDQVVFVDGEGKIEVRAVDIARADAEFVYVRGGANAGDRIVLTALESPINGMAVRTTVREAE
jgi:RND family efflux transporter MFP subunit